MDLSSEILSLGTPVPQYEWCGKAAQSLLPSGTVALVLLAIGAAYVTVTIRGRRPIQRDRLISFGCGIGAAILVVTGPVERLALDRLFTAYILQQFVLVMIAPPLMLAGTPDWMVRPLLSGLKVAKMWRRVTNPVVAFCTFSVVFSLIHLPSICDRVCHIHQYYYGIRALLLVVWLLLWWPLLSPLPEFPRLSYPVQIFYLFLLLIPMTAVSAPITLAESILYDFYLPSPHPFGLSPLDDQVLGGLCMWVVQGLYLMAQASLVFCRWSTSAGDDVPVVPDTRREAVRA